MPLLRDDEPIGRRRDLGIMPHRVKSEIGN